MNRLAGHTAYLSGPMDRIEWNDAVEWRDEMDYFLHEFGIGTLNPCSKPSGEQESPDFRGEIQALKDAGKFDEVQELMKPICRVDLRMVDRCDFVIAHVDMNSHMCGTYWEVAQARMARKPVILHCKKGISAMPNWLFGVCEHEEMFDTWSAVQRYILSIHRGEHTPNMKYWHFFNIPHIFGKVKSPV